MLAGMPIRLFEAAGQEGVEAVLPLCRGRGPFARWRMPGAQEVFEPGDALCRDSVAAGRLARELAAQRRSIELARVSAERALRDRTSLLANKLLLAAQDRPLESILL